MTTTIQSEIDRCIAEARRRLGQANPIFESALTSVLIHRSEEHGPLSRNDIDFFFECLFTQYRFVGQFVVFRPDEAIDESQPYVLDILYHSPSWDEVAQFMAQTDQPLQVEFQRYPYADNRTVSQRLMEKFTWVLQLLRRCFRAPQVSLV